jgi:two-component system cell cycle response regulator
MTSDPHVAIGARVLIIDDDAAALWLAEQFLDDAGFDVQCANTLFEFETLLANGAPDIVVADVNMPSLSGAELCRILKGRYQTAHIPVVLFSALPDTELAELAQACEAERYLSKMAGLDQLAQHLEMLCQRTLW